MKTLSEKQLKRMTPTKGSNRWEADVQLQILEMSNFRIEQAKDIAVIKRHTGGFEPSEVDSLILFFGGGHRKKNELNIEIQKECSKKLKVERGDRSL